MPGMRSQLIVDVSDRMFCALVVTPEGDLVPVSHEIQHVATRYLSSEILLDPRLSEDPDFVWEDAVETLSRADARSLFQRARRLGLRRPWELQSPGEALRLASPLTVLSSPAAILDPVVTSVLPAVGIVLLDALLEPVFAFLATRNIAATDTDAVVVIPAHAGRRARLAIRKVFRRRGFRELTLLSREIAAAMALVDASHTECLVWDVTDDDLHLYRVAMARDGEELQVRTMMARTAPGLGWSHWVRQIGMAVEADAPSADAVDSATSAMDRALVGLLTGSPVSIPQTVRSSRLSHGLIEAALGGEWGERLAAELHGRLGPQLAELNPFGLPVILLGALCGLDPLRRLFLSLASGDQPLSVAAVPVLERTTRGVAAALMWLRGDAARRVRTPLSGSLRLNNLRGEAAVILEVAHLPPPGQESYLRQHLQLCGNAQAANPFLLQILWGSDTAPEGNASLCALPLEIGASRAEELPVRLTLHLRRNVSGRQLIGTVEARLGIGASSMPAVRAFFVKDFTAFPFVDSKESLS